MRFESTILVALVATVTQSISVAAIVEPAIVLAGSGRQDARLRVEVVGLDKQTLAAVEQAVAGGLPWSEILSVRLLVPAHISDNIRPRPMWGATTIEGDRIVFRPRFALGQGRRYVAEFTPPGGAGATKPLSAVLLVPPSVLPKPAQVLSIWPSADTLPENLLKFYITFRQPMARGDAYAHLVLLDSNRREVSGAFLELGEELWDPRGRQFTLLFDPGRIKRGVTPNQDMGAPLVSGRSYTLVVKAGWRSASGLPLAEDYEKPFDVGPADRDQPRMDKWMIHPPKTGSTGDLLVDLDEPLDWAMLGHAIAVVDSSGQTVSGDVRIGGLGRKWRLRPHKPWKVGAYRLVAANTLEDLAGNSLGRAFEERIEGDEPKSASQITFERRFGISP